MLTWLTLPLLLPAKSASALPFISFCKESSFAHLCFFMSCLKEEGDQRCSICFDLRQYLRLPACLLARPVVVLPLFRHFPGADDIGQLHPEKHPSKQLEGLFIGLFQAGRLVLLPLPSPLYSFLLFFTNSSDLRNDL